MADEEEAEKPADKPADTEAEKPAEGEDKEEGAENAPSPRDSMSKIDRANEAAERLERANKKHEALLDRQEEMQVEKTLGGKAEAGDTQKKEDDPEEYARKVMANEIDEPKTD